MFAIKQQGASNTTEVHILNGADNYDSYLLQTATALQKTGDGWDFEVGDYNNDNKLDLYAINHQGGSNTTAVHVLDGASNYTNWLLQRVTALKTNNSYWEFEVGDYNNDGTLDVIGVNRQGQSSVDVHVLNGQTHFSN